MAYFLSI